MCTILLSINPQYVESIMSGKKIYEFRKTVCKRKIDKIVIYSTTPIKQIVGEAEVERVLVGNPDEIWEETREQAGIQKSFFDTYYKNKEQAVAYKLCNVVKYKKPKMLEEYGIKMPPQSFQYLDEK